MPASAEAVAVGRDLALDEIAAVSEMASSYLQSAALAADRRDLLTLEVHLRQAWACLNAVRQTFKEIQQLAAAPPRVSAPLRSTEPVSA
jgi:hypothetical protein